MKKPQKFNTVVQDTEGRQFTVSRCYWQLYAGGNTSDYTVEFKHEPTHGRNRYWNKSQNLTLVKAA